MPASWACSAGWVPAGPVLLGAGGYRMVLGAAGLVPAFR
jgi:hypothetical protein